MDGQGDWLLHLHCGTDFYQTTGYSRKNSPIWEANKFETKEDTANVFFFFLFLESTQYAVLHQRVLNKTSLKWQPLILIHRCSPSRYLSVTLRIISGVMAATRIAVCLFQCRTCSSKVRYPTVNHFLIRNSLPSTKRKADAKCTLCSYRRPTISYKLLDNKGSMFSCPRRGVH